MSFEFKWKVASEHGFVCCDDYECKLHNEIPSGNMYVMFSMPGPDYDRNHFYCEDCGKKMVEAIINEHKYKVFK